ncbi:MAG: hypothetical protein HEEMFOPI_00117 [Holosporales bacterium]
MFEKKIFEIPLSHEMERRHLSAVVGIMVFLLTVLLILSVQIGGSFFAWKNSMTYKLTIKIPTKNLNLLDQVPVLESETAEEREAEIGQSEEDSSIEKAEPVPSLIKNITVEDLYNKVTDLLKNTPSVIKFQKIQNQTGVSYLNQWFGGNTNIQDFNLPLTIDVEFCEDKSLNIHSFLESISTIHPKIHVDYNERLQETLHILGNVLKVFSGLLIIIVTVCLILLITLVTQSSLKAHASIIDTLRLLGAKNRYIVNIYQFQAFKSVLFGGFMGAFLGIAVMYLSKYAIAYWGYSGFSYTLINTQTLQIFLIIPFLVAFLALFSARVVVKKELRKSSKA